jgi:hypothetical protein
MCRDVGFGNWQAVVTTLPWLREWEQPCWMPVAKAAAFVPRSAQLALWWTGIRFPPPFPIAWSPPSAVIVGSVANLI